MARSLVVRELITRLSFRVNESQLRRAENRIQRASRAFSNIGRNMTLFVTAPLALVTKGLIGAAAEVEILDRSFEALTGSAEKAKQLRKELFQLAVESPLLKVQEIGQVAKRLLAFQVPLKEVVETTQVLGNIAAAVQVPIGRLAKAYGDVISKGRLQAFETRQFGEAGVGLVKILQDELGKNSAQIEQMISDRKISAEVVTRALRKFAGDGSRLAKLQEEAAKSTRGQFLKLQDRIFLVQKAFGDKLLPTVKRVLMALNRFTGVLENLNSNWKRFILITGGVVAAIGPVLLMLLALKFILSPLFIAIGLISGAIAVLVDDFLVWRKKGNSVLGLILGDYDEFKIRVKEIFTDIVDTVEESVRRIIKLTGGLLLAVENLGRIGTKAGRKQILKGLKAAAAAFEIQGDFDFGETEDTFGGGKEGRAIRAFLKGKANPIDVLSAALENIGKGISEKFGGGLPAGLKSAREKAADISLTPTLSQRILGGTRNVTINVNGAGDPGAVAKKVSEIEKRTLSPEAKRVFEEGNRQAISNFQNPEINGKR